MPPVVCVRAAYRRLAHRLGLGRRWAV